jgi:4-amino-4-deoxy-L-arabinose transferase-like glycosyltransferase
MAIPLESRIAARLLLVIVLVYVVLGTLYAALTPAWQAPDEPAHYNYVQYIAEYHRFPILKPGDYPAAYLEEIKSAHFPAEMSITPIRYEFHQPPFYYILAVPLYRLFAGALLPLRLLSVATGAILLALIYWAVQELFPGRPSLALGAAALVAFLPMHLAMTAACNNDTLAELLLAAILLLAIRYLRLPGSPPAPGASARLLVLLGVTTGLALLTKSSVYIALPLVLLAIWARHLLLREEGFSLLRTLRATTLYLVPALGLALPWWVRNLVLYGGLDFLGLGRHDQVVAGQLRTADFVAEYGFPQLINDFFATSFRSFWGQFGWMGVLLDQRIYQALAILSALALLGFVMWAIRVWQQRDKIASWRWLAGGLLALLALLTLGSYVWYNTGFLQHQGRYLFRALAPIGLAAALGWREALRRDSALPLAGLVLAGAVLLRLAGVLSNWPLLLAVLLAVALTLRRLVPDRWDPLIHACPYLILIPLDLASLFLAIVPQLAR